jgi:hypothetical protein
MHQPGVKGKEGPHVYTQSFGVIPRSARDLSLIVVDVVFNQNKGVERAIGGRISNRMTSTAVNSTGTAQQSGGAPPCAETFTLFNKQERIGRALSTLPFDTHTGPVYGLA